MRTSLSRVLVGLLAWLGTVLLALGLSSWLLKWPLKVSLDDSGPRPAATVTVSEERLPGIPQMRSSFAETVKRIAPSVVYVFSTKKLRNPSRRELFPFFDDPVFRRFFGDRFDEFARPFPPGHFRERSLGSGVVVSADGHILTNHHVIEGADEIKVTLATGNREYSAKLVGADPPTDIAILKIEASDLSVATLSDSDNIEVGDVVLAVGNPFGVGQTVTMGLVSAVRRGGMGIEEYEDFIQTDAAVNPGNSGGALVDVAGRLIGIPTAIVSPTGASQGVGFAVPINVARLVMEQILTRGRVERGYLGVAIQDLDPDLAEAFDVPEGQGALVSQVLPGTPAAAAGLQEGDVIVGVDQDTVANSRGLKLLLGRRTPGTNVTLRLRRNRAIKTLNVTLGEMPAGSSPPPGMPADEKPAAGGGTDLPGVALADIDADLRQRFGLPPDLRGAVIVGVEVDSVAHENGLRAGDVIQDIERQPVGSVAEAAAAIRKARRDRVLMRVWSHGRSRFVVLAREGR